LTPEAAANVPDHATLRGATMDDVGFLRRMTYEAAFWRPGPSRPDFERGLATPGIGRYVEDWGREGDEAVIALVRGRPVGAAWFRRFEANDPGFGFVGPDVPELAIAVEEEFRGRGIGDRLLRALLSRAVERGVARISLSVNFDNPAARLYRRLGFRVVGSDHNSWTMVAVLQSME
jgi:ribosomal protein S18 acetylase RimI-like enzyme